MKKISLSIDILEYDNKNELDLTEQTLIAKAEQARDNAYAPYSNFSVGAAVLLDNGIIISGNNQENAAYPSGLCAERTAIFYAAAQYPNAIIKSIAITVKSETKTIDSPIPPCGACRQAIAEYEFKQKQPINIIFTGSQGKILKTTSLIDLLPLAFNSSYM